MRNKAYDLFVLTYNASNFLAITTVAYNSFVLTTIA